MEEAASTNSIVVHFNELTVSGFLQWEKYEIFYICKWVDINKFEIIQETILELNKSKIRSLAKVKWMISDEVPLKRGFDKLKLFVSNHL